MERLAGGEGVVVEEEGAEGLDGEGETGVDADEVEETGAVGEDGAARDVEEGGNLGVGEAEMLKKGIGGDSSLFGSKMTNVFSFATPIVREAQSNDGRGRMIHGAKEEIKKEKRPGW